MDNTDSTKIFNIVRNVARTFRSHFRSGLESLNIRRGYVFVAGPNDILRPLINSLYHRDFFERGEHVEVGGEELSHSHLVRSLWLAGQGRILDSADALCAWLADDADAYSGCLFYIHSDGVLGLSLARRAKFSKTSTTEKLAALEAQAKVRFDTDAIPIVAALVLARQYRKTHDLEKALVSLKAFVHVSPVYARFLEHAEHALNLEKDGRRVPGALRTVLGDEDDYLARHSCGEPFKNFFVTHDGGVTVCCGVYLPTHIGNVVEHRAEDVLNSEIAQDIRKSVLDGSFRYCDFVKCPALYDETLPVREEVLDHETAIEEMIHVTAPKEIMFGLDLTCNLMCPQCRKEKITVTGSEQNRQYNSAVDGVVKLLHGAEELVINPSGEVFASKSSRRLLHLLGEGDYANLKLNIITNGVLFSEQEWAKFDTLNPMLNWVRVSVDAASKPVYDKIRVGGDFEKLSGNLKFIQTMRERGIIKQFEMLFVYQLDNYKEIPAFARWAKSLSCDRVIFQQLHHYGHAAYSAEDVARLAVFERDHECHDDFIRTLENIPEDCLDIVNFDVQYDVSSGKLTH